MPDPLRPPSPRPVTPLPGPDSQAVVDQAIASLGTLRDPDWLGDAGVRVHVLATLIAHAQALLPTTVAEARDQGYSWAQIGDRLGVTARTAARRFRHATTQEPPLD
jgi:hypothetical protein